MKMFKVKCCGKRRGLINGILVCSQCDFDHSRATTIPNISKARDVPDNVTEWNIVEGSD